MRNSNNQTSVFEVFTVYSFCSGICEANLDNCSSYATCSNTDDGGFSCSCNNNFAGSGDVCTRKYKNDKPIIGDVCTRKYKNYKPNIGDVCTC